MFSDAVLQVSILFLPGIIWAKVDSTYASRKKPSEFEFLINSLIFGLVSYVAALALAWLGRIPFQLPTIDPQAKSIDLKVAISGLLLPIASAAVLSILWCYAVNYRIFIRFLSKIGASRSFGDQDVWEFTLNSNSKLSEYVNIRDYANELVYSGYVRAWSGTSQAREILLVDVQIYDGRAELLYKMPMMYLSRPTDSFTIEFPAGSEKEQQDGRS